MQVNVISRGQSFIDYPAHVALESIYPEGFEFNAELRGGFVHFWSDGNCELHRVDYVRGIEVIPITLRMTATAADAALAR